MIKSSGGVRRPGMVHGKESWARRCGRLDSSSAQRNPHVLTIDLINMPPKEPPQNREIYILNLNIIKLK